MDALIEHSAAFNSIDLNPPTEVPSAPDADAVRRALPPDIAWRGMGTDEADLEIANAIHAGWNLAEGRTRQIWTKRTIDVAITGCYYVPPYFGTVTISAAEYFDCEARAWVSAAGAWFKNGKGIFELRDEFLNTAPDWRFRLSYAKREPPLGVQLAVASLAAWELSTGLFGHEPAPAPETPESPIATLAISTTPTLRGDPFRSTSAGMLLRWYAK